MLFACTMVALNLLVVVSLLGGWLDSWMRSPVYLPSIGAQAWAFGMTFQPFSGPWRSAIRVTRRRVIIGRIAFAISTAIFVSSVAYFVIVRARDELAIELLVVSLFLATQTYMALHWAFRPENLFTVSFVRFIASLFSRTVPRSRRRQ